MKTDLRILKEDVTKDWNKDFLRQLGISKVFDFYVINFNQFTYCCELQPSVWCEPFTTEYKSKEQLSDVHVDQFDKNNSLDGKYIHYTDSFKESCVKPDIDPIDFEYYSREEYNEEFEEILDYLYGNPLTF